jgi:GntR family transcriptional regulator
MSEGLINPDDLIAYHSNTSSSQGAVIKAARRKREVSERTCLLMRRSRGYRALRRSDFSRKDTIDRTFGTIALPTRPDLPTATRLEMDRDPRTHPLFRDSPVPRYVQLAGVLRQRIARGVWTPGERVPTLDALVREFGVARVTVRQAVDLLARDGLLSAERGRGTFVLREPARDRWLRLQTTLADLADVYRHDEPTLTLIEEAAAKPALRPEDGTPAARYHFMRRVHSRRGEPYCVISIYLDQRVFRKAPARFRRETVIPVMLDLPGVTIARAQQTLTISTAEVELAGHLRIPVSSPVAEVRRVFAAPDGTVLYLGEVTYRGDYIRLEMDLKP